jgi:hypothetical protein
VGESIPTNVSDGNVGEGVPSNVSEEMLDEGGIHWIPLGVSAVVAVMGVVLAVAGNNLAKDAREEGFTSTDQYERNKDKAHKGQILRGVGIGLAIAGAVGIGLSVAF